VDLELAAAGHRRRPGRGERGFTVIEVLIAMLVLLIGMAGILTLQLTAMQATSFSRHATEASILSEDKMEALRTMPINLLSDGSDQVDARGVPDEEGLYTRAWTVTPGASTTALTVSVSWNEQGAEPYTITMSTLRSNIP
jgi:type IV pilus assembly protein PilV